LIGIAVPRAIDHLVIAAHDLAAQAALYRRLGFQVGPRNRHPWGTENHIVQFDGAFLELISLGEQFVAPGVAPGDYSFADFIGRFLARREGLAMMAMRSEDAEADRQRFAVEGLGAFPRFDFARKGRRADGSEVDVAFSLAFAQSPALGEAGFFVSQQHFPQNFWSAALQVHPNGATGVAGIVLAADSPADHADFLRRFVRASEVRAVVGGLAIATDGGMVEALTKNAVATRYGADAFPDDPAPLLVTRIAVADLAVVEATLRKSEVIHRRRREALVVPAEEAFGVVLVFEKVPAR
jgi:hypothetical protein